MKCSIFLKEQFSGMRFLHLIPAFVPTIHSFTKSHRRKNDKLLNNCMFLILF